MSRILSPHALCLDSAPSSSSGNETKSCVTKASTHGEVAILQRVEKLCRKSVENVFHGYSIGSLC